jgi:deoxyhypusine synthase
MSTVKEFIQRHFRHFNAAVGVDAAEGWHRHLAGGGKMMLTMGGAMSTADMGLVVAELIRRDKVHALTVTGANLEEDIFNLVAHRHYVRIQRYRDLSPGDEKALLERHLNRVTDTCIPEEEAMRKIERKLLDQWRAMEQAGERLTPGECFYRLIRSKRLEEDYEIDPKDSWLVAAAEKDLPIWVPGWEDSTLGNMFVSNVIKGKLGSFQTMKSGLEQMAGLVAWYKENAPRSPIGFFQVCGGISGDFPICVVPLLEQVLGVGVPEWA